LEGAVLLKAVQVKSVYLWLASWPVLNYGQTGITGRRAQPFLTIAHFKLLQRFFWQIQRALTTHRERGFLSRNKIIGIRLPLADVGQALIIEHPWALKK
jgi:hypothetical protein